MTTLSDSESMPSLAPESDAGQDAADTLEAGLADVLSHDPIDDNDSDDDPAAHMTAHQYNAILIDFSTTMSDKVTVCNAWILTLNTLDYMDELRNAVEDWVTLATMFTTSLETRADPEDTSFGQRVANIRAQQNRFETEFGKLSEAMRKVIVADEGADVEIVESS